MLNLITRHPSARAKKTKKTTLSLSDRAVINSKYVINIYFTAVPMLYGIVGYGVAPSVSGGLLLELQSERLYV